jgi:hypothetical protein
LFEVLSTGDLRQPRNPWDPDRWPYATAVRALAGLPPIQARSVDGVRTPRATAYRVQAEEQRLALYDAMRGHEYATTRPAGEATGAVGLVERARALRRVRPFDPDAFPARRRRDDAALGSDEAVDLDEKTQRAHHELLARLHAGLRDRGWSELGEIPLAIDLQGRAPRGEPVIFEAKTLSGGNETRQCRAGLAQLLEYRQDYGAPDHELCLVVDRSLSPRRADLLDRLGIPQPEGGMAHSEEEALTLAERIGYPVIVRPSFVIGGLAIDFCYSPQDLARQLALATVVDPDRPVRIDRYLEGVEVDVDVSDLRPGGRVTVTVTCRVSLADLVLVGVPGTKSVVARGVAVVDENRS